MSGDLGQPLQLHFFLGLVLKKTGLGESQELFTVGMVKG